MNEQTAPNGVPFLTFDHLQAAGLLHAVLTRRGGVSTAPFASLNLSRSVADRADTVAENRRRAYGVLGRELATLVHAHLVHEATVRRVGAADHGRVLPTCDALITDEPGCGLTMNFADCAPIVLYDPDHHAVGLAHAGWRGTIADVAGAMVRAMAASFGSDPAALLAAVGPCIGPAVYEVGPDVIEAVEEAFPAAAGRLLIAPKGAPRPYFDLPEANRLNLTRAGVNHIEIAPLCTGTRTDLFFSHRAEGGQTGRVGVVVICGR